MLPYTLSWTTSTPTNIKLCKLWDKKAWVYHSWCKKLLIDVVFCSICFRNIWKGTSIPLRIPLAEFASYARTSPCILCRGYGLHHWWVGPESNGLPLIFSQVYQPCIPPTHMLRRKAKLPKALFLCEMLDSNQRPIDYQSIALPSELTSLQIVEFADVPLWGQVLESNQLHVAYEASNLTACPTWHIKGQL